ncbi:hypothetical protein D9M71_374570 [compost metagenome]
MAMERKSSHRPRLACSTQRTASRDWARRCCLSQNSGSRSSSALVASSTLRIAWAVMFSAGRSGRGRSSITRMVQGCRVSAWPPPRARLRVALKPPGVEETLSESRLVRPSEKSISPARNAGSAQSKASTAPFSGPRRTW